MGEARSRAGRGGVVAGWFAARGWKAFPFQRAAWRAWKEGKSGLIHAPTGLGKTWAAFGGVAEAGARAARAAGAGEGKAREAEPIRLLWVTPLRALAADTAASLAEAAAEIGLPWTVELRTGDTAAGNRARQRARLPSCLVTTPESLTLLLTWPEWRERFASLQAVVVDEWHELLGSKRGVQTELALARLRHGLETPPRVWGLSATLGNLDEAMRALLGPGAAAEGVLVQGKVRKRVEIATLIPERMEHFPWSGHLGLQMVPRVVAQIEQAGTTLVFTNTRSQTEAWYRSILQARPEWANVVGIHHGSLERELRAAVERGLDEGKLKAVVCTSSLDLGVDFAPVDQVIQVGSPKGIARLLQRAGRSGHRPGAVSRIVGAPTHAFELVEYAAARDALERGEIESRRPLRRPLDVLLQHLVTCALGGGFAPEELWGEVRSTHAYADLEEEQWEWALDFAGRGGAALRAYPEFARMEWREGRWFLEDRKRAQRHRLAVGTITSEGEVVVRLQRGGVLGTVEESFAARLRPGETFFFAGRRVSLVRFAGLTAVVRTAEKGQGHVPSWQGGRSPLSTELARAVCRKLAEAGGPAARRGPEMAAAGAILDIQKRWSELPGPGRMLVEWTRVRRSWCAFFFPFGGRLAHEGLGTLVAWRLAREAPLSLRVTPNDYGFALESNRAFELDEDGVRRLFAPDNLMPDLLACLNAAELAKRQFREIARVAGLIQQGYPGQEKSTRQVQASSSLLYEVFARYDPGNRLLAQAQQEVFERQLELARLRAILERVSAEPVIVRHTDRLTPLSFPLWADQIGHSLSTVPVEDRIRAMVAELEQEAAAGAGARQTGRSVGGEASPGERDSEDSGQRPNL